jgi:hypothetical protein
VADGSICSRREQRFYRHCPRYKGRCALASAGAAICKNFWCASGAYHCRESASASPTLRCARFGPAPSYAEKSAIQKRISFLYNEHVAPQSRTYQEGEVSHEKMRARTRLLAALQGPRGDQAGEGGCHQGRLQQCGGGRDRAHAVGHVPVQQATGGRPASHPAPGQ